jgi:hypothetical protein
MDAEPGYEDHPIGFRPENGYLDADDVRKFGYWALLAGACGHTYGCHDIWQFYAPGRAPITAARTAWTDALDLPGAGQMRHLHTLALALPLPGREPDQGLLASDPGSGGAHIRAMRGAGGAHAIVYVPDGRRFTLRLGVLAPGSIVARWFDPRSGGWREAGAIERAPAATFTPPSQGYGQDWALVLECR